MGAIGHFEKYHNILKIVMWVVLHVNRTFALSFVSDLLVQIFTRGSLSKVCLLSVFAQTFNVGQSMLYYFWHRTLRISATREVSRKVSLIR